MDGPMDERGGADVARGNLIAGRVDGGARNGAGTFENEPVAGAPTAFPRGTPELVDAACRAAAEAFGGYGRTSRSQRAALLRRIGEAIEARGAAITAIGTAETGLPGARLDGERGRTVGQLRLFADHIEDGAYLDRRHDAALPDRAPLPRPDLRLMQRPIGPVAVFGASNFPLAFSVAGGDTASALAAGCPVVVKGHPGHPGTGALVGEAIAEAVAAEGLHPGTFSLVNDGGAEGGHAVGEALVRHPAIRAVGFTGSLRGGRALYDIAAARPDPIPFFGELGSVNPVFVLPAAAEARLEAVARGWVGSLTLGVGQFCTNPGLVIVPAAHADAFVDSAHRALHELGDAPMLTGGIARAYAEGVRRLAAVEGVELIHLADTGGAPARVAATALLRTDAARFTPDMAHEVFGPSGLVIAADGPDAMLALAGGLKGQLTATLHLEEADHDAARALMPALERVAGRILCNGFPTGVEVADAMMHGGPWPASTNASTTSVGTLAIRRWLRPVCYQDVPEALLPDELRD